MKFNCRCYAGCAALLCAMVSLTANAESVQRTYTINAAGNCNGALPSHEAALRKRPTGISNESTSNAFITCSLPGDEAYNEGNTYFGVTFTNNNNFPVEFTCTFVDGVAPRLGDTSPPDYYPQTVYIIRHMPGHVDWGSTVGGPAFTTNANLSCSLPPRVEINGLVVHFEEDNGVEPPAP